MIVIDKDFSFISCLTFIELVKKVCFINSFIFSMCKTSTLVQEAHPALDELTSKISTLNLERVRQIKSRLVTISGRVQKVRIRVFLKYLIKSNKNNMNI